MNEVPGIPSQEVLYDKIIDVDLIYSERNEEIDGYYITQDGKKVSGALDDTPVAYSISKGSGGALKAYTMYRFKGYSHKEYLGGSQVKEVRASGKTYRYDLSLNTDYLNFHQGYRPDGSRLQAGDKLYVNNHGVYEQYHVDFFANVSKKEDSTFSKNNTWDTEIYKAVPETRIVKGVISIRCNEGGVKPTISFSTNIIQGQHCYKLQLKITNLSLDIGIRNIKHVRIKAGYRSQNFTEVFICPVFSSYIESPNPDGVTVFECLCVGRTYSFTENRPYTFSYLGGSTKIRDLIAAIAVGMNLEVVNKLIPKYNDLVIQVPKMDTYAENGVAIIEWLRNIIQRRISIYEGIPQNNQDGYKYTSPYTMVQVNNGKLLVYMLNRKNADSSVISTNIVSLDQVRGATFNGVALTVKASWNPRLNPGDLFQMRPNIINGASLPNTLDETAYGNDAKNNYLYRCVTVSIVFSTNGNENEMSVLALPIKYLDEVKEFGTTTLQTMSDFAASLSQNYITEGGGHINIGSGEVGTTTMTEEYQKQKAVDTNTNNMFDLDIFSIFGETYDYTIVDGDNLSTLAGAWFNTENSPVGPSYCPFSIYPRTGMIPKSNLWPLIAVLTYRYWLNTNKTSSRLNAYESMEHLKEPNLIRTGNHLVIPKISSVEQLKQCKNIFKYAATAYENTHPDYRSYVYYWNALYKYLSGETSEYPSGGAK